MEEVGLMPAVETVRGPVDTADLGRTLMHEHVFVLGAEHVVNYGAGAWWDEETGEKHESTVIAWKAAINGKHYGDWIMVSPPLAEEDLEAYEACREMLHEHAKEKLALIDPTAKFAHF